MKHWYQSKTLWLNLVVAVISASVAVFTDAGAPAWVISILSTLNLILRGVTTQPISFR